MSGIAQEVASYSLRLYVTGATPGSSRAIAGIKAFCEKFLKNRYTLEVIDVYQQPVLADEEGILATPTLVRMSPLPLRRIVGNLSDPARLHARLGLPVEI
ncbi:MAG TPA: circadian clock KaiB family protein [Thermoanaerobaculia bacterium]|nr:circadian clock KaiB family protein [Thermoanaerobaculia bacterium]